VDAVVAEHEAAADETIVPVHVEESDAALEAEIEAEATPAEKKPAKAATPKADKAETADAASTETTSTAKKPASPAKK